MEELETTFMEEYLGASEELKKERYKNATILFCKALFAVCDMLIYSKLAKLPKNHGERFRILETYFPDAYAIADAVFSRYTDAYSKPVLKETCEKIKDGIKNIVRTHELPKGIKKVAE